MGHSYWVFKIKVGFYGFFLLLFLDRNESFGLILQNLNFIYVIGTIESYLGLREKRVNFGITIAEIQQKVWERRRKGGREKMLNFDNVNTEIPLPNSCCSGMKCAWSAQSEKKNKIVTIVAMSLPKMGGKKNNGCRNLGRN